MRVSWSWARDRSGSNAQVDADSAADQRCQSTATTMDLSTSAPQNQDLSAEERAEKLRTLEGLWFKYGYGKVPENDAVDDGCCEADDGVEDEDEADVERQVGIDEQAAVKVAIADQVADDEDAELEVGFGVDRGEPLEDVEVEEDDVTVLGPPDAGDDEVPRRERAYRSDDDYTAGSQTEAEVLPPRKRQKTVLSDPGEADEPSDGAGVWIEAYGDEKCPRCKSKEIRCFVPKDPRKTACRKCKGQKKSCQNARSKPKRLKRRAAGASAEKIKADIEADTAADIESIRADILLLRGAQIELLQNQTTADENLGGVRDGLRDVRAGLRDLMAHVRRLGTLLLQLAPPENLAT